jgi:hypothetical protein
VEPYTGIGGYKIQDLVASLHALSLIEGVDFGSTEVLPPPIDQRLASPSHSERRRSELCSGSYPISSDFDRSTIHEETSLETRRMLVSHIDA